MIDRSNGWEAVADRFVAARSAIGAEIVADWARTLPPGAAVVDIGCGSGWPVATTLAAAGCRVAGIDPAPTLLAAFRQALPDAPVACEAAEQSRFFDRRFDGAVAIGLLFLLPAAAQAAVIARVGRALVPGGRFLFSAPRIAACWTDMLTGRGSRSLGEAAYRALLARAGMDVVGTQCDSGGSEYWMAVAGREGAA